MKRSVGALFSTVASFVLIAVLLAAFLGESFWDVMIYYGFNTINPLLAGLFAVGVIVAFTAVRLGHLSEVVGTGVALGFALSSLIVVVIWALTGRVDVFLARGWMFPAQRWVLVGVSALIVGGVILHAWNRGLVSSGAQ